MANFTAANVKALRERAGAGMMDVQKALTGPTATPRPSRSSD